MIFRVTKFGDILVSDDDCLTTRNSKIIYVKFEDKTDSLNAKIDEYNSCD